MVNKLYPSDGGRNVPANLESEFTWTTAKEAANLILLQATGKHLSDLEIKVLQGSWEGKTYDQIASSHGYSAEYLNKDIGNKLWSKLSDILGEKVTKKNFKEALGRAWEKQQNLPAKTKAPSPVYPRSELPFPEGSVALDSPLYRERSGVESLCYQTVMKPGSLIRIKAPNLMGKTSLMMRILAHSAHQKYQTVYLDLGGVDRTILTDLNNFLRWLCLMVSRQLNLENRLNEYWDTEILGSNDNCTAYFEEYLLAAIDCPFVLGLDDLSMLSCLSLHPLLQLHAWHGGVLKL
ncbi:MAG: AAA-like domain-containing protein [Lyngbya sp.]|nr:AAA-like domain-containing protein [Lyngbya sp.]